MTAPVQQSGSMTGYLVQTYLTGARGTLKAAEQIQCRSEDQARTRAEKLMAAGRVLGVDVVRQISDPEAGEYSEPEFLVRLGRVPEEG